MNLKLENEKVVKDSLDDENEILKYGQSICHLNNNLLEISIIKEININNQNKNVLLFGLFDGHNGLEVSKYLSLHFPQFFSENSNFINGNYKKSLEETFINLDDSLRSLQAKTELSKYSINKEQKSILNENELFNEFLELFEPRNLKDVNIADFCGSSGIVILITEKNIFIANSGSSKCVPINNKNEIIKEKINRQHMINDEYEIKRLNDNFLLKINDDINKNNDNKLKDKHKFINNFPLRTTRGFGDFQYKDNKLIKLDDQYILTKPDIIEIPLEDLNYLIIGNYECFSNDNNILSLEKFFLEQYTKNKDKKISSIIEEFFEKKIEEIQKDNESEININNMASIIIEFKHENNLNNINTILFREDKKEINDINDSSNKNTKSEDEEENL